MLRPLSCFRAEARHLTLEAYANARAPTSANAWPFV